MTQDVIINIRITVCFAKMLPSNKYGELFVAQINGSQILDMLSTSQMSDIKDIFYSENDYTDVIILGHADYDLNFEVGFDDEGEVDAVDLNGGGVSDILGDEILERLKRKAKSDHIADCKDRGIKYKGGA